ncbi:MULTISPECIES: GntR family transcriptional regulator [Subtercola]|nr:MULTISPECIES: GntR family transcriptional regulator [Subtercola]MEA9984191.1 GntR family transcriptional regulator [Subtercola sp. RTI3]
MSFTEVPRRELLGQAVASVIRNQILGGEIHQGERLALAPLSLKMEMSITPVREALLLLAQDGWVVHEAHRGFRVAAIRRDDVIDTYLMWATAEGEIAARAAARRETADIVRLRAIDARLNEMQDHHTGDALALNTELHVSVHQIADAPKLAWFADAAARLVPLRFADSFTSVPGWAEVNRYGHTSIIDSIEAGNIARSRVLMHDHFMLTADLLLRRLDAISFWEASVSENDLETQPTE